MVVYQWELQIHKIKTRFMKPVSIKIKTLRKLGIERNFLSLTQNYNQQKTYS